MPDQIIVEISEALDAYQLARRGTSTTPPFEGTRDEWLASLVGPADTTVAAALTAHAMAANNPHGVTKLQLGLGNVDNTSDTAKPVSIATQTELDKKVDTSAIVDNLLSEAGNVPLSAQQGKILRGDIDRSTSKNVIYLSSRGIVSDTDLSLDGTTTGTTQTAAIQAILDMALSIPLLVVWDVRVTVGTLIVHSNTTISALTGCGAKLANGTNSNMFRNAHFVKGQYVSNTVTVIGNIVDESICITGGIWHGNRANNVRYSTGTETVDGEPKLVGYYHSLFKFFGVKDLLIERMEIRMTSSFAGWFANNLRIITRDIHIDQSSVYAVNSDGFKFCGPARSGRVSNFSGRTSDDLVSVCSNEATELYNDVFGPGEIHDFIIDGLEPIDSYFGLRVMSSTHAIDRLTVRNFRGNTRYQMILVDNYDDAPLNLGPNGPGNVKRLLIEDFSTALFGGGYKNTSIYIACKCDDVQVTNMSRNDDTSDLSTTSITFGPNADLKSFKLNDYTFIGESGPGAHIVVMGKLKEFEIVNPTIITDEAAFPTGTFVLVDGAGEVECLIIKGLRGSTMYNIVSDDTGNNAIGDLRVTDGASLTSNWLTYTTAAMAAIRGNGWDVDMFALSNQLRSMLLKYPGYVPADSTFSATIRPIDMVGRQYGLLQRVQTETDWQFISCYDFIFLSGGTIVLAREQNGVAGVVLDTVTCTLVDGADYHAEFTTRGSALNCYLQASDGGWLQSDGSWGPQKAPCLSATDTMWTSGRVGFMTYSPAFGTNGTLRIRDVKITDTPMPVVNSW